jgi:hypothetical protein
VLSCGVYENASNKFIHEVSDRGKLTCERLSRYEKVRRSVLMLERVGRFLSADSNNDRKHNKSGVAVEGKKVETSRKAWWLVEVLASRTPREIEE